MKVIPKLGSIVIARHDSWLENGPPIFKGRVSDLYLNKEEYPDGWEFLVLDCLNADYDYIIQLGNCWHVI